MQLLLQLIGGTTLGYLLFVTSFSTIFHLYRGGQYYWWRKMEYQEKTTDLPQVTNKLDHIKLQRVHLVMSQTWGQLLANVIDYITITLQFSNVIDYITITL
jgi:hypothetical protein